MNRSIFWVFVAGLVIFLLLSILMPAFGPGYDADFPGSFAQCFMGPWHFWSGGLFIFPIIMLFIMLFFVYIIFSRGGFRPPWYGPDQYHDNLKSSESALEILKKRYAKGEITKEEFEQMKKDIV